VLRDREIAEAEGTYLPATAAVSAGVADHATEEG
jgi:hypothetical protein